jgi:hypothetical protein
VGVTDIHGILQCAHAQQAKSALNSQPKPVTPANAFAASFGSSNSSPQPAVFDQSLSASFGSNGTAATAISATQQPPFAATAYHAQALQRPFGQVTTAPATGSSDEMDAEQSDVYVKSQSIAVVPDDNQDKAGAMNTPEKSANTACPNRCALAPVAQIASARTATTLRSFAW